MGDRTPAAGPARLTEEQLVAMETRAFAISPGPMLSWQRECFGECQDVLALIAALRAAWAENARLAAASQDVLVAFEPIDWILPLSPDECHQFRRAIVALRDARAALAAPGAGTDDGGSA